MKGFDMLMMKFCKNCETETEHYTKYTHRCRPCSIASAMRSNVQQKAKRKAERALARSKLTPVHKFPTKQEKTPNIDRGYIMNASVYMGEKWADVRGQMKPTVAYISGGQSSGYY